MNNKMPTQSLEWLNQQITQHAQEIRCHPTNYIQVRAIKKKKEQFIKRPPPGDWPAKWNNLWYSHQLWDDVTPRQTAYLLEQQLKKMRSKH